MLTCVVNVLIMRIMLLLLDLTLNSETYFKLADLSHSRVSILVLRSGEHLDDLAQARSDIATLTNGRAMRWFSDHWPEYADWPGDIVRPVPRHKTTCQREQEPNSRIIQGDPE